MQKSDSARAAVEAWRGAVERSDEAALHETFAELCVIGGEPRSRDEAVAKYVTLGSNYQIMPVYRTSEAGVITRGDTAQIGPIYEVTFHHANELHLSLAMEDGRWLVNRIEDRGRGPIERGLPGLGAEYLEQTERWAMTNIMWVGRALIEHPPDVAEPERKALRRHAVTMLDEVLHLRSAPHLDSVRYFLRVQMEQAISRLEEAPPKSGIDLYKMYDHGWIVRTATHTWAHDLVTGYGRAAMAGEQLDRLLGEIEALFISHWHRDHAAPEVIRAALSRGIPVITAPPCDGIAVPDDIASHPSMLVLDPEAWELPGQTGEPVPGLEYTALPGHQDHRYNAMFHVEADDVSVLQTGDQYNDDDWEWIDRLSELHRTDALLAWLPALKRIAEGARPRVLIPGHENELGHLNEHREPYDQAYERLCDVDVPSQVLVWGERLHVEACGE